MNLISGLWTDFMQKPFIFSEIGGSCYIARLTLNFGSLSLKHWHNSYAPAIPAKESFSKLS